MSATLPCVADVACVRLVLRGRPRLSRVLAKSQPDEPVHTGGPRLLDDAFVSVCDRVNDASAVVRSQVRKHACAESIATPTLTTRRLCLAPSSCARVRDTGVPPDGPFSWDQQVVSYADLDQAGHFASAHQVVVPGACPRPYHAIACEITQQLAHNSTASRSGRGRLQCASPSSCFLQDAEKVRMGLLLRDSAEARPRKGPAAAPDDGGDKDVQKEDISLVASGACGAFVHGLEDEFEAVRLAAIGALCLAHRARAASYANAGQEHERASRGACDPLESLEALALTAEDFAISALDLLVGQHLQTCGTRGRRWWIWVLTGLCVSLGRHRLAGVDMLSDEIDAVRVRAIAALERVGGHFPVRGRPARRL